MPSECTGSTDQGLRWWAAIRHAASQAAGSSVLHLTQSSLYRSRISLVEMAEARGSALVHIVGVSTVVRSVRVPESVELALDLRDLEPFASRAHQVVDDCTVEVFATSA